MVAVPAAGSFFLELESLVPISMRRISVIPRVPKSTKPDPGWQSEQ
jgi:hypothetical protein